MRGSPAIIVLAACSSPPKAPLKAELPMPTPAEADLERPEAAPFEQPEPPVIAEPHRVTRENACWQHIAKISLFTESTGSDREWQQEFQRRTLSRICALYESPEDDREIELRIAGIKARAMA